MEGMSARLPETSDSKIAPSFFKDPYYAKFFELMPFRVKQVLLVSSPYDYFILEEDGRLSHLLNTVYKQRDLGYIPTIYLATSYQEAEELAASSPFDLVILVLRAFDKEALRFAEHMKRLHQGMPVVALAFNGPEVFSLIKAQRKDAFDEIFLWQGDGRLIVGIVQLIEDKFNAEHDVSLAGIPNLLLVEDSPDFYSSYLNLLYEMLWELTASLLEEKLPFEEKVIRQRGRPRLHLATTFEEALSIYKKLKGHFLGVISDASFPQNGQESPTAGYELIKYIRSQEPHLPIILQSSENSVTGWAKELDADLILKNSPSLVFNLRPILFEKFGFGDLVLRGNNEKEIARIPSLQSLIYVIDTLPPESIYSCYKRGCLRRWLLVRTEFQLASALEGSEFQGLKNPKDFRQKLSSLLNEDRVKRQVGKVAPYSRRFSVDQWHFCRMGGGSLGGKARGLVFFDKVLSLNLERAQFPGVKIEIPRTLVLGTDIFDEFLETNKLTLMAYEEKSDIRIANAFINASLSPTVLGDLRNFIREVRTPLAIRSSSLLEDALYHPFAGIYLTKMIPNSFLDLDARFLSLVNAIKLVYASTFFRNAKSYLEATNNKIQEEKMAVIVQEVVGQRRDKRFYPDISGVAKSYNYYPFGGAKPEDGVANIALGLGKTVVEGEASFTFIPKYPRIPQSFNNIEELIAQSQRHFYCINMQPLATKAYTEEDQYLLKLSLEEAEKDGVLKYLVSTYSQDEDRLYDGLLKTGARALTFAHILKNNLFPLSQILVFLLDLAREAMGTAVEIEFACSLNPDGVLPAYFGFLQLRPMVGRGEFVEIDLQSIPPEKVFCFSQKVLGNGIIDNVKDVIVVKQDNYDQAKSARIAQEVGTLNEHLRREGRPYILIGPGRWGSADPWLGIPVRWEQISGVKAIVETPLKNLDVEPSQGSHFFHNLSALRIGYFTVSKKPEESFLDYDFLDNCPTFTETEHLKLLRFEYPFTVKIDGRKCQGVILKPEGMK